MKSGAEARRRIAEGFLFIDLNSDFRLLEGAARAAYAEAVGP